MGFEIERVLYQAEDYVLRNLRSGSLRDARKRRAQRTLGEIFRRLRRSAFLLAGMLAALVVTAIFITPIGFLTWLVAIPTAFLIAFLSLFWPTRRARQATPKLRAAGLGALAERAAAGLLDRCDALPGRAIPTVDAIAARLHELAPHLEGAEEDPLLAGDARRLIGRHLPQLIDSFLALPAAERGGRSESSFQLIESLATVEQELEDLLERCCRDRRLTFETHRRFIATRYGEDEGLSGRE